MYYIARRLIGNVNKNEEGLVYEPLFCKILCAKENILVRDYLPMQIQAQITTTWQKKYSVMCQQSGLFFIFSTDLIRYEILFQKYYFICITHV